MSLLKSARCGAIAAAFLAAGCSRPDPVANESAAANALPPAERSVPSPAAAPPDSARPTPGVKAAAAGAEIPPALHGRWGLTPGDCTSALGDAKGLLVITAGELRFYESRAVPSAKVATSANAISGDFHFTGEGQSWTKYEALKLDDHRLIRTETNPTASFAYAKCS